MKSLPFAFMVFLGYVMSVEGQDEPIQNRRTHQRWDSRHERHEPTAQIATNKSIEQILESIVQKLSALQSLDEEHIKRLDSIELRMSKSQGTTIDKADSLSMRSDLRNLVRKVDTIGTSITNMDATLNQLKLTVNELQTPSDRSADFHQLKSRSVPPLESDQKLEALAVLLTSTRSAIHRVEQDLQQLQSNFSQLQASTKTIHHLQRHMPTKQFLNSILQNARTQIIASASCGGQDNLPASCSSVDGTTTGIYQIQINANTKPFYARCDETSEDKWMVILNRFSGDISFYRNWLEYKNGFGNVVGDFWIGLDKLYEITNSKLHELYIVMQDFEGVTKHARYAQFAIGSEKEDYALNVLGQYSGTAGDSLSYHAGSKFSTFDVDNDVWSEGNCAQSHTGGWWYNSCDMSNLNGKYLNGNVSDLARFQGMYWNEFHGPLYSLKSVKMLVQPIDFE